MFEDIIKSIRAEEEKSEKTLNSTRNALKKELVKHRDSLEIKWRDIQKSAVAAREKILQELSAPASSPALIFRSFVFFIFVPREKSGMFIDPGILNFSYSVLFL